LKVHAQKSLDNFPTLELLHELPGLDPLVLEAPPVDRKSTRHFHSSVCFGMTGEVCTGCVIHRELASEASEKDQRRAQVLQKWKRPVEWRSVEELLDRAFWMQTAWEWHLCQWAISRFGIYKTLVQLKYFGWSCDLDSDEIDQISDASYEEAWHDLDFLCGGLLSGRCQLHANTDGCYVLPGKRFLYVGEQFPAECFRKWGFRGVRLGLAAGHEDGTAWNLSRIAAGLSRDEVPWPRTPTGMYRLWPEGETEELTFDLLILDEPPKTSALVPGFLAFFLSFLDAGGALLVKLSSLPKCKALTALWHLVRIFGCGSVRLRKPGVGPDVHRSSFYVICRNFPGAGLPALWDLLEVSQACLQSTSREVEVGAANLPPMPTCIPTSPIVSVRNLCALLEALSRDAKPIWTKQYVALRAHLLVLSAQTRPDGPLVPKESGLTRRKGRQSGDSTAAKKAQLFRPRTCTVRGSWTEMLRLFRPRTWSTRLYSFCVRLSTEQVQIIFVLVFWIAVNFFFLYPR
jgi:hypothetical protein